MSITRAEFINRRLELRHAILRDAKETMLYGPSAERTADLRERMAGFYREYAEYMPDVKDDSWEM